MSARQRARRFGLSCHSGVVVLCSNGLQRSIVCIFTRFKPRLPAQYRQSKLLDRTLRSEHLVRLTNCRYPTT